MTSLPGEATGRSPSLHLVGIRGPAARVEAGSSWFRGGGSREALGAVGGDEKLRLRRVGFHRPGEARPNGITERAEIVNS